MKTDSKNIQIGKNKKIDDNVLLGYLTDRKIDDKKLKIGDNARIRSGSVIYVGSIIGDSFSTGHNVVIREENRIGNGVSVWSNSIIDYACKIGHRARIHCSVYIAQYTTIDEDVFLAPGVKIGNDPIPICSKCLKGPTIKQGARIGINSTVLPSITIGKFSLVGAGSVVTKDVPEGVVVAGNPARIIKKVEELKCPNGRRDCEGIEFLLKGISQIRRK